GAGGRGGAGGGVDARPDVAPPDAAVDRPDARPDAPPDLRPDGSPACDCSHLPHVRPRATLGCIGISAVCDVQPSDCEMGFAHCMVTPNVGCESDLTRLENCGSCGNRCGENIACVVDATGPHCSNSPCSGTDMLCGGVCVDFGFDQDNCGG